VSPWSNFPAVRLALAWASGLWVAHCWAGPVWIAGTALGGLLLMYMLLLLWAHTYGTLHRWSPWIGLLGLSSMGIAGYLHVLIREPSQGAYHLRHWADVVEAYEATALQDWHSQGDGYQVTAAVRRARIQGTWQPVWGKIRLRFPEPMASPIRYGDILLVRGPPQTVPPPQYPYGVDYQQKLRLAHLYHQHFLSQGQVALIGSQPPSSIQALAFRLLHQCQAQFTMYIQQEEVRSIVLALLLGQRDTLVAPIKAAYADGGVMHVLAISGLHIGILYWCITWFLSLIRPLRNAPGWRLGISLAVLYVYALMTQLAASVLRATLMLTLVALSQRLDRPSNIYNTLATSAFVLLLWTPQLLFDLGLQLSYLAVLGIVYLHPKMNGWLRLRNFILKQVWLLTTVSLAAQLATLPLSSYYFHRFPTYFLLANWVVVPAVFVMLCLGIGVLVTSPWPSLSAGMAWLLAQVVHYVNQWVQGIQQLPYSCLETAGMSAAAVVLWYGLLLTGLLFLHQMRWSYLVATSLLALLISVEAIHRQLHQQTQCQVMIGSPGHSHQAVAFVKGQQATWCMEEHWLDNPQRYTYMMQAIHRALGIVAATQGTAEALAQQHDFPLQIRQGLKWVAWQGKLFLFVDQKIKHLPPGTSKVPIDVLVIGHNAITTLQPWLDRFALDQLVIGASNRKFVVQQLQAEAQEHHLKSHAIRYQGAFTMAW